MKKDKKLLLETLQDDWAGMCNSGLNRDVPAMECFHCGANMVRRHAPATFLTNPPHHKLEWWCECGVTRVIRYEEISG